MSLDRRLREGIDRLTSDIDPDVERHLQSSRRVARRRIRIRRTATGLGVAASIALVVLVGPRVLDAVRTAPVPADRPTPSVVVGPETIAGTYTVTVDPGPAVVEENALAGIWTFELSPDGSMVVTPPPAYPGTVEGFSFEVDSGVFRTDAFVNDLCNESQGAGVPVGEYRWELVGEDLELDTRADTCAGRAAILDGILRASE
jgi:hypothetical protein